MTVRKMDFGLLLCLVLGWASSGRSLETQESVWTSYSWGHPDEEPLLPLSRPRGLGEPQLLYAIWEPSPLLVKEGITSEEAAWVPGEEPLELIKERYISGSREFDYNFSRTPEVFPDTGPQPTPFSEAHTLMSLTPRHPRLYPTLPRYIPPRKYYITGLTEEIKHKGSQIRKYKLREQVSSNPNEARPVTEDNKIPEFTKHKVLSSPRPQQPALFDTKYHREETHSVSEDDKTHRNPVQQKVHQQHYVSLHHPRGCRHPPIYPPRPPPPPYLYHRPHYLPHIPASFKKYYLSAGPSDKTPPPASAAPADTDKEEADAPELSSFEVYKKLRQPRMISTAWVSTRFRLP